MYYCEFCNYKTKYRKQIESHHIQPKSMNGSDKPFNRCYICANCHSAVFVDHSIGKHSTLTENSIIIHGWKLTTQGRVLYYTKNGIDYFQEPKN